MKCYLLLIIDISVSPPKVMGCSTFSEESPTFWGNRRCFTVYETEGVTYGEAKQKMVDMLGSPEGKATFGWVLPILEVR